MSKISILLGALAGWALASCSGPAGGFDHLLDFTPESGNTGNTTEHITDKPQQQFHMDVVATSTDEHPIEPKDVLVTVTLVCKTGPSYQNTFTVALMQNGLKELEGSFDRSAPECVDPGTGQNGIAVWGIVVTRVSPGSNFNVHIVGYLN